MVLALVMFGFAIGFLVGHLWGQCAGINWCIERDKQFRKIEEEIDAPAHSERN